MTLSPAIPSERRERAYKTAGYFAAFIILGLFTASMGPTLPALASQTSSGLAAVSFLFTARALGYQAGSLGGGRSYDRLPGHSLLFATLLVMGAMIALVPLATTLWMLIGVMFVLGVGEGTVDVGGNTLLLWTHRHQVGPLINGLHFFFGVGSFLSPIFVAQAMLWTGGVKGAFWFLAVLPLPVAFWLLRLPSPVIQEEGAVSQGVQETSGRTWLVILIAIFFFLYVGVEAGFGGWIYTYVIRQFGAASGSPLEVTAAYLTSAFWGAFTVGRLAAVPLALRFRPRDILLIDMLGSVVSLAVLLAWPKSMPVIWAGSIGLGISLASIFPTTLALAERRLPITGAITRWFFVGAGVGGMLLPWLLGQLFEYYGPLTAMWAMMIDLGLMFFAFAGLWKRKESRVQEIRRSST